MEKMTRNIFSILHYLFFILLTMPSLIFADTHFPKEVIPEKYAGIVVDFQTGKILYAENADSTRYPASLTKLMTLYLVFNALEKGTIHLNDSLIVSAHAASQQPSKLALKPGQNIRVEDAILGVVTKSANDAATVLAESLGGTEENFANQMTQSAKLLGMTNSEFYNASGLPNLSQHTSASDMAKLALALIHHFPQYYGYFNTRVFIYNGQRNLTHNRLINNYTGMDGLKTGYIHDSGFNLVASAIRNGKRVVAVVLGGRTARSRDRYMAKLLDQSFAELAKQPATFSQVNSVNK